MITTEVRQIKDRLEKWVDKVESELIDRIIWALAMDEKLWQMFRAEVRQTQRELYDERSINVPVEGE